MLKTHPAFEDLIARGKRGVARGTILKSEGDDSHTRYYVAEGWLATFKSLKDGERQIIDFILPDETYDPTAANGKTSSVQLEAVCDAVIVVIDSSIWARLLHDEPALHHQERLRDSAAQARQSERMLRLGRSSAETRIAYVLIELCLRVCGPGKRCEGEFHIPLGQQQLGDFTGLSSVHVCRTLRRLNRLGMITTGDHMDIAIHDVAALADLADVDLATLRDEIIPAVA